MNKIVLLFNMVLGLISYNSKDIVIDNESEYYLLTEEEQTTGLIDNIGDYYLIKNEFYYLMNNNKKINLGKLNNVKMFVYENKLLLVYSMDGSLYLDYYSSDLDLINELLLARNGINGFNCKLYDNNLIIYGESDYSHSDVIDNKLGKSDALFINVDLKNNNYQSYYYGGKTDEYFSDGIIVSNSVYLCGHKDSFGEGDFGNGGADDSIFITKLTNNRIDKYKILDKNNEILSLFNYNNKLYLVTSSGYYIFSSDLEIIKKINIDYQIIGAKDNGRGLFCLFSSNNCFVIDLNRGLNKILAHNLGLEEVESLSDYLLGKKLNKYYRLDLISLANKYIYYGYNENKEIDSLFKTLTPISEVISPRLDYQVFGEYEVSLKYETLGGIDFTYLTKLEVPFELNITNGGIYPYGYHILFTGKGYLDGNQIINNYQLVEVGKHELVLKGVGDVEKKVSFEVDSRQIDFIEEVTKDVDLVYDIGDMVNLKLKFDLPGEFEIYGVEIEGATYSATLNHDLNILYIPYGKVGEAGLKKITVDRLLYKDNDNYYSYLINEDFMVNIRKPKLEIKLNEISSDLKIVFDCIDSNNVSRYFEIVKRNEVTGVEESFKYPISKLDIYIDNYDDGDITINWYLVNDYGESDLEQVLITSLNLSGKGQLYLGNIQILSYDGKMNRFSIDIDDDLMENELKTVTISDQIVYTNERDSYLKYLLLLVLTFLVGIIIPPCIKEIIKRNKRKRIINNE